MRSVTDVLAADTGAPRAISPSHETALWLTGLYALILIPIVRGDRLYNDDLKRALFGRTGWDSNGRPLTTLLMKLLQCYNHALVDISPFTQLAAGTLLVWAGTLIARRFCRASPLVCALATFPLGAQPFFLENLSYKFDALSMALALLTAIVPFVLIEPSRRSWRWGTLSLFVCLNLYQPALNAFLVFALLEFTLGAVETMPLRSLLTTLRFRLGQVIVAGVGYELLIGIHVNGWVKRKSAPIHSLNELPQFGANVSHFVQYIGANFNMHWWMYFGPPLVVLGLSSTYAIVRYASGLRDAQPSWAIASLVVFGFLLPPAAILVAFGPLLLLADPPIAPRVLVGIGPLLCAALIAFDATVRSQRFSQRWPLAIGAMFAGGFCIIASAYGNAMTQQKVYEEHIALEIADDLGSASAAHAIRGVLLDGSAGYAPITAHVADEFPIVRSLTPAYLDASDTFHPHIFLLAYMPEFVDVRLNDAPAVIAHNAMLLGEICDDKPTVVRGAYRLYVKDDIAVVLLGRAYATRCTPKVDSSARSF